MTGWTVSCGCELSTTKDTWGFQWIPIPSAHRHHSPSLCSVPGKCWCEVLPSSHTLVAICHCSCGQCWSDKNFRNVQGNGPKTPPSQKRPPTTATEAVPVTHPNLNPAYPDNMVLAPAGWPCVSFLQKQRAWCFQDLARANTAITGALFIYWTGLGYTCTWADKLFVQRTSIWLLGSRWAPLIHVAAPMSGETLHDLAQALPV